MTVYYRGQVVGNGGSSYVCILDHTSSAGDEPGVGGSWTTYWAVVAAAGTGLTNGDKGDITVSAGGATWTIDNDAVTFAKLQNITTDRLLGRDTASSGDTEELTVGGGIEFTGSGGIRTTAFTGDVTKTAGGTVLSIAANAVGESAIADNAVTYAKIQLPSKNYVLIGDDTTTAYKEIESSVDAFALIEGTATSTNFANLGFKTAVNRNISEGTASPTGGADGDIYLQYV